MRCLPGTRKRRGVPRKGDQSAWKTISLSKTSPRRARTIGVTLARCVEASYNEIVLIDRMPYPKQAACRLAKIVDREIAQKLAAARLQQLPRLGQALG